VIFSVMAESKTIAHAFTSTLESVVRQLARFEQRGESAFIHVPVLYPSGAGVVVRVDDSRNGKFFVTDMGLGYQEAEMMGASLIYLRHAKHIAENAGIQFDSEAFFVIQTTREQLAGAIATVANCSQEAVALAAYKLAERRATDVAETLYERLVRIFTPPKVEKNAPIFGASNTEYHFAAVVTVVKKPAVFEAVANHPTSIAFASSKFHDLALLERPPTSVAVVRKKKELGTYHNLLAQVANVIEIDEPDERIEKLARAA
jgi:hypothetical protein